MVLNWKHHTLIQALMSRGPLIEREFHSIFQDLTGCNPGTQRKPFDMYLLEINKELSYINFELRACRNQYNGQVCYGVVNNVSDEQSKLGTKYSVPQIAFYRGIIEAISQDADAGGSISNIAVLNIELESQAQAGVGSEPQSSQPVPTPAAFRNFSMSQKEKTLEEFVKDKWLSQTADGNIGLGLRSFLDLRSWFRNADVPSCEVCNEAGVKAEICPNEGCTVRVHQYCLKTLLLKKDDKACPGCGEKWPFSVAKAEFMEEEERGSDRKKRPFAESQPGQEPRRKKLRRSGTDDADEASGSGRPGPELRRKKHRSSGIDDADEASGSGQPGPEPMRKKLRRSGIDDSDEAGGSSTSQAPELDTRSRRVTRRTTRLG